MFERIVVFWKGNDIVHLFGGFLRFGAQDKGPDQQHCQQPRGEPGEIQPHVLELGAPVCEDLDGLIDGGHKEPAAEQVHHRVETHLSEQGKQAGGQPAQAGEFREVGGFPHQVEQRFLIGDEGLQEPRQQVEHVQAQIPGLGLARQGVAPNETQVAQQEQDQDEGGGFAFRGHGRPSLISILRLLYHRSKGKGREFSEKNLTNGMGGPFQGGRPFVYSWYFTKH